MAFEWINKKWSPNAKDHSNDRKDIICDTEDDVSTLPESAPGSTALVVATGNVYVVNASRQWVEFGTGVVIPTGGGGGSDTLTWDGNTEGLVSVAGMLYKISDAVLTLDDVKNGAVITASDGDTTNYTYDEIVGFTNQYGFVCFGGVYCATTDDFEVQGMVFPKAGIYVMSAPNNPVFTQTITIPGYTGF